MEIKAALLKAFSQGDHKAQLDVYSNERTFLGRKKFIKLPKTTNGTQWQKCAQHTMCAINSIHIFEINMAFLVLYETFFCRCNAPQQRQRTPYTSDLLAENYSQECKKRTFEHFIKQCSLLGH